MSAIQMIVAYFAFSLLFGLVWAKSMAYGLK